MRSQHFTVRDCKSGGKDWRGGGGGDRARDLRQLTCGPLFRNGPPL